MQRRLDLHKWRTNVATIGPATISTITTGGKDQMGSVMKNQKKKRKKERKNCSEDQMGSVIKKKKKKGAWDHQKREKRIEGSED